MDRWIDRQMDRWIDEQMDRGIDGEFDRWLDVKINRMRQGERVNFIAYQDVIYLINVIMNLCNTHLYIYLV